MNQPGVKTNKSKQGTRLLRFLDGVTRTCTAISGVLLLLIMSMYVLEVVLRYVFNTPTVWSIDTISFALAAMISMATPELARQNMHISITLVPESIRDAHKRDAYGRVLAFISAAVIGYVVYVSSMETYKLFDQGILTVGTFVIPKWWVAAFIPVGLFLTAAQYLRLTICGFDGLNTNAVPLEVR